MLDMWLKRLMMALTVLFLLGLLLIEARVLIGWTNRTCIIVENYHHSDSLDRFR